MNEMRFEKQKQITFLFDDLSLWCSFMEFNFWNFIFLVIEHLPQELRDRFTDMREMDLTVQSKCKMKSSPSKNKKKTHLVYL